MKEFVFYNPTRMVFGAGSIAKLGKECQKLNINKVLLVIGQNSVKNSGLLDKVLTILKNAQIDTTLFEGITPNPTTLQVEEGAQKARSFDAQAIVALGGGSVMDASKVIALLAKQGGNAWDYTSTFLQKGKEVKEALPIITIPTVAATGSEADPIAVLNNPQTSDKNSVSGLALYPKLALIDPELTLTCPISTTMDGIIDILAHAIETYFSNRETTPIQDGITETVAKTLYEMGKKIMDNPFDIEARNQISWASTLVMAGFLTGRNGGWPLHAIEHAISGLYPKISHGAGLAALLVPMIAWDKHHAGAFKLKGFLKAIKGIEIKTLEEGFDLLIEILKDLKSDHNLKKLGVKKEDLPLIAQKVLDLKGNKEEKLINLVPMGYQDILKVLEKAYEFPKGIYKP